MRLPLPWLLALRYLKSSRRDAYVSLLSALATGGITLGVAALILVLSGLAGLQGVLRDDVLSRTPHLEIELPPEADAAALAEELRQVEGIHGARRILRARGWLLARGSAVDVEMVGYEGTLPHFFPGADDFGGQRGRGRGRGQSGAGGGCGDCGRVSGVLAGVYADWPDA